MAPTKKKVVPAQRVVPRHAAEKEPEYMIQLADPTALRKDILESLREVIVFMQGYEQFRKIQGEKVVLFAKLKTEVREMNSLIDNKLRKHFPKGKLKPVLKEDDLHVEEQMGAEAPIEEAQVPPPAKQSVSFSKPRVPLARQTPPPKVEAPVSREINELDELEAQLREIEGQLNNLK